MYLIKLLRRRGNGVSQILKIAPPLTTWPSPSAPHLLHFLQTSLSNTFSPAILSIHTSTHPKLPHITHNHDHQNILRCLLGRPRLGLTFARDQTWVVAFPSPVFCHRPWHHACLFFWFGRKQTNQSPKPSPLSTSQHKLKKRSLPKSLCANLFCYRTKRPNQLHPLRSCRPQNGRELPRPLHWRERVWIQGLQVPSCDPQLHASRRRFHPWQCKWLSAFVIASNHAREGAFLFLPLLQDTDMFFFNQGHRWQVDLWREIRGWELRGKT